MRKLKLLIAAVFVLLIVPSVTAGDGGHYNRGVNYYLDGKMEEALETLESAYEEDPGDKRVKALLSEVLVIKSGRYYERKNIENAFELIKRAREIAPDDEKVESVYFMLDEKLHPEKYEVPVSEIDDDAFADVRRQEEEKREERVRIIKSPPEQLTVREKELLRPILIGFEEESAWRPWHYIVMGSAFLFVIFLIAGGWVRRISAINARVVEQIAEKSETRGEKLEADIRRLREKEEKRRERESEEEEKRQRQEKLKEEKIKARYQRLLKESRSSGTSPRKIAEPRISESKKEEAKRRELVREFKKLNDKNPSAAVELLKKMTKNTNPWIRLGAAQLASVLDAENARQALYGLIEDREYGVKKEALKTLRGFMDSKTTTLKEKRLIRELIDRQRSDGWVV